MSFVDDDVRLKECAMKRFLVASKRSLSWRFLTYSKYDFHVQSMIILFKSRPERKLVITRVEFQVAVGNYVKRKMQSGWLQLKLNCVAYSISSMAETRDRALHFLLRNWNA